MTRRITLTAFTLAILLQKSAHAGMPSPQLIITEIGKRRLEEVSFFLIGFLLMTGLCRWLWNGLAKDIGVLPKLSYRGALCMMLLWGLALTVVLSLVSGARELMTPAAWEPNGITHRLAKSSQAIPDDELAERRVRLLTLKKVLWDYAATHDTEFPSDLSQIPEEVTIADTVSGLPYFIQPNLKTTSLPAILIGEPDVYPKRLLLLTDGSIVIADRAGVAAP